MLLTAVARTTPQIMSTTVTTQGQFLTVARLVRSYVAYVIRPYRAARRQQFFPRMGLQSWHDSEDQQTGDKQQIKYDGRVPVRFLSQQKSDLVLVECACDKSEPDHVDGKETEKCDGVKPEVIGKPRFGTPGERFGGRGRTR